MAESKINRDAVIVKGKGEKQHNDVTEAERELAQLSLNEFNDKNYSETLSLLSKLLLSRPKDIKVLCNRAVVEYYSSNLKKTEEFQKMLNDICVQANIKIEEVKSSDEVEASVIRLNRCTVMFHLQQHRSARALLQKMYKGLESLEESVSIGLCLLLAESLLAVTQPGQALGVVAHTEATFLPQPLPPQNATTKLTGDKDSKSPESLKEKESSMMSIAHGSSEGSNFASGNIMSSHTSGDSIGGSSEMRCSADQELLRGKLQLLRVRSLLMMRIFRAAKKELKNFVTHVVNSGHKLNVTLIMLKSQQEYLKGGMKKAIKVLNQCAAVPPPGPNYIPTLTVSYYNNLGVIHLGLGKPTLACFYLEKALREYEDSDSKEDDTLLTRPLYSLDSAVGVELCYNLGVTLLFMKKPSEAFDFLIEVVKVHPTNPRLWLRLAECCIAAHEKNNLDHQRERKRFCWDGRSRGGFFIPTTPHTHEKKLCDEENATDSALPIPTLEFGLLCLRNSLSLIPDNFFATNLTDEQEGAEVLPEMYPSRPSPPLKGSQLHNVKLSCMACSAYVSLCLGNYPLTLHYSQALLGEITKVPQVHPTYSMLGHLYSGEALVLLGRTSEALSHFDPKLVEHFPPSFSNYDNEFSVSDQIKTDKLLLYNLSATYAIRGHFEEANKLLKEIYSDKSEMLPSQVIMLAFYINIQLGCSDALDNLLKEELETVDEL